MQKIYALEGQGSVSYGGTEYPVGKDGSVEVPEKAVGLLCDNHGFSPNPPVKADKVAPKAETAKAETDDEKLDDEKAEEKIEVAAQEKRKK